MKYREDIPIFVLLENLYFKDGQVALFLLYHRKKCLEIWNKVSLKKEKISYNIFA